MKINNYNNTAQIYNKKSPQNTCAFKGHLKYEKIMHDGVKLLLRKETALYRNIETKNFVIDYISKFFSNQPQIKMVVAGCSTGEEAFSYSMLLNKFKDKLSILGFDLSKNSIADANSRKITIQTKKNKINPILEEHIYKYLEFQNDTFLISNTRNNLSHTEQAYKKLFDEFFELSDAKIKEPFFAKLKRLYLQITTKAQLPQYEFKTATLKKNKCTNCTFKTGDIMKLKETLNGEKADIITFSNAMYHLITEEKFGIRYPKSNAEEIIKKLAQNVKDNLNPNGIFVLGEKEFEQTLDSVTVEKVFKEMGFRPLNKTTEHSANVYQLLAL